MPKVLAIPGKYGYDFPVMKDFIIAPSALFILFALPVALFIVCVFLSGRIHFLNKERKRIANDLGSMGISLKQLDRMGWYSRNFRLSKIEIYHGGELKMVSTSKSAPNGVVLADGKLRYIAPGK
jgi:hypothetical protein